MNPISLLLACVILIVAPQSAHRIPATTVNQNLKNGNAGYFFSLSNVPLSQKQYIFSADPLKKAILVQSDRNVTMGHTMTLKTPKGFDMYFSGSDFNVVLAIKQAQLIDEMRTEYKGTLSIQHGSEKQRYAVHGFQLK